MTPVALLALALVTSGVRSLRAQSVPGSVMTEVIQVPAAKRGRFSSKPSVKYDAKSNTTYTWMTWEWAIPIRQGPEYQIVRGEPTMVKSTVFAQYPGKTLTRDPTEIFLRFDVVRQVGAEPVGKQHRRKARGGVVKLLIDSSTALSYPVEGVEKDSRFVYLDAVVKAPRTNQYMLVLPIGDVLRLAAAETLVQGEVAGQYFEWNKAEINNLRILLESLRPE